MEESRYRIMFTYRMRSVGFLCLHCFDTIEKQIVTVPVYSGYNGMEIHHDSMQRFPEELLETLRNEKEKIDDGFYSIRTWDVENLG
ncbi:hypothetical protein [Guptibacillus sedimenti]|uniref:hypothetical protein n=1 Tax=Guptibacillus sedimenti TaxID=3025680 RepID=UPI002360E8CD|nr:hypothetical protein [Pseudalkalibacillus sedimenti]